MALGKEELSIKITLESDGAAQALQQIISQINALQGPAKRTGETLGNIPKQVGNTGSGVSSFLTNLSAPITALNQGFQAMEVILGKVAQAYRATVGAANELELTVAKINTLLSDQERETFNARNAVLDLQFALGGDQQNIAKGFYETLASGAIDVANAQDFMRVATKAAVAGLSDVATAQKILTATTAAFGDAAGTTAHQADVLFIAAARGATDFNALATDLGAAYGTAQTLGVSFEELAAFVSSLTLQGITTAEAVTATNSAMIAMARQTEDLTSVLKDLYKEDIRTVIAKQGLVKTLRDVTMASGGSAEAVIALMGRTEALKAVAGATSQEIGRTFNEMYQEILDSSKNVGAASGRPFEMINSTTSRQMDLLSARVKAVFTDMTAGIGQALGVIASHINRTLAENQEPIKQLSKAFSGINVAGLFEAATPAIVSATAALVAFGAVMKSTLIVMAAKIGVVVTGITTIVVAIDFLIRNIKNLGSIFETIFRSIQLGFVNLFAMVGELMPGFLGDAFEAGMGQAIADTEAKLGDALAKLDVGGIGGTLFQETEKFFSTLNDTVEETGKTVETVGKKIEKQPLIKPPDAETLKRYEAIKGTIKEIGEAMEKSRLSEEQATIKIAERQLAEIDAVRRLLASERRLTGDRKKELNEAESLTQRKLAADLANIQEKRIKESRDASIQIAEITGDERTKIEAIYERDLGNIQEMFKKKLITEKQYVEASKQLERDRIASIAEMQIAQRDATINGAMTVLEGIKGGAHSAAKAVTKSITDMHTASVMGQQALGKLDKGIANESIKRAGWIGQLVGFVIDVFGKTENEFRKWLADLLKTLNRLPNMILGNVPVMIEEIVKQLPDAIPQALQHVLLSTATIVPKVLRAIIKSVFSKELWRDMWKSFVDTFKEQVKEVKDMINELFTGEFDLGETIKEALDPTELQKTLTGVSDELFGVIDVMGIQKAEDVGTQITDAVKRSLDWIGQAWEKIKQAARWVYDMMLAPFVDQLKAAWTFIDTSILKPSVDAIKIAWRWVYDTFLAPFITSMRTVWQFAQSLWSPFLDSLDAIWRFAKGVFTDPVGAWNTLVVDFKSVSEKFTASLLETTTRFSNEVGETGKRIWEAFKTAVASSGTFFETLGGRIWNGVTALATSTAYIFENMGRKIWAAFQGDVAFDFMRNVGLEIWKGFYNGIVSAWGFFASIGTQIWNGLVGSAQAAWGWVYAIGTQIWYGLYNGIVGVWSFFASIGTQIWSGVVGAAQGAWDWIYAIGTQIWYGLFNGMNAALFWFQEKGTAMWEAFKAGLATIGAFGTRIWNGFVDSVGSWFFNAGKVIWEGFKSVATNVPGVSNTNVGGIELDPRKWFAKGGIVRPLYAEDGTLVPFTPQGTDTVPAMLTPGEFVLQRAAVQRLGVGLLDKLNRGTAIQSDNGSVVVNLNITTEQPIDERFIRSKIMPTIKEELRRSSIDGRRILAPSGVR
jgi:TP901 family phage tail tape measure protein